MVFNENDILHIIMIFEEREGVLEQLSLFRRGILHSPAHNLVNVMVALVVR